MYAKVLKENPYRDPTNGQFTTGPKGGGAGDISTGGGPRGTANGRRTLRGIKGHIGDFPRDNRPVEEVVAAIKAKLPQDQLDAAEQYDKANEEGMKNKQDSVSLYAKVLGTQSNGEPDYEWTPERQALHDEIIADFFKDANKYLPPEGVAPRFVTLGGRGGSGKSQLTKKETSPIKGIENFKVLDPDDIKKQLTGYDGTNAALFHEESGYLNDKIMRMALYRGMNMVNDVTLKSKRGAKGTLDTAHRLGYRMEGHYMHLPADIAGQRAMKRATGETKRYVPLEVIAVNKDNEKNFQELVDEGYFEAWSVWNNDVSEGQKAKLVSKRP